MTQGVRCGGSGFRLESTFGDFWFRVWGLGFRVRGLKFGT
jgi:hypothetical protein